MHDETLKKIALTGVILGLLGLFAISMTTSEEDLAISRIKLEDGGSKVSLTGEVVDIRVIDGATILTISRNEEISVFVQKELNLTLGDTVRIKGRVEEYRGRKEIMASQVLT